MVQANMVAMTRVEMPPPKPRKVAQPPPPTYGLEKIKYRYNQLLYNPKRARQEFLHAILPFFFEDPIASRRKRKELRKKKKQEKQKSSFNFLSIVLLPFAFLGGIFFSPFKKKKEVTTAPKKLKSEAIKIENKRYLTEGGFGKVYKASYKLKDKEGECAIKVMYTKKNGNMIHDFRNMMFHRHVSVERVSVEREAMVLKKLKNKTRFVVELIDDKYVSGKYSMYLEFCAFGDLTDMLTSCTIFPRHPVQVRSEKYIRLNKYPPKQPHFPINLCVTVMAPMFDALRHMHELNYMHRDVKPQNVLVDARGIPKLCDFGTAVYHDQTNDLHRCHDQVGSSYYMAPESVCKEDFTYTIDTWLMGISMLVLVYGWGPYHYMKADVVWCKKRDLKKGMATQEKAKVRGVVEYYQQCYDSGKFNIDGIIHRMLGLDKTRFQSESTNTWLQFRDFLKLIFVRDVRKRPTCAQLCEHEYIAPVLEKWRRGGSLKEMFPQYAIVLENIVQQSQKQAEQAR